MSASTVFNGIHKVAVTGLLGMTGLGFYSVGSGAVDIMTRSAAGEPSPVRLAREPEAAEKLATQNTAAQTSNAAS